MKTTSKSKDPSLQDCQDACLDAKKTRDKYGVTKLAFLISAIVFAGIGIGFSVYIFNSGKPFDLFSSLKALCSFTVTYKLLQQYRSSEIDYKSYNSIYQDWKKKRMKLRILNSNQENIQIEHDIIDIIFTNDNVPTGKNQH